MVLFARTGGSRLVLTASAICVMALTLLAAAPALAKQRLLAGSFGSFGAIQGIAVDESTGDVYVYDGERGEILKFDANGTPTDFSALGTNTITGVGTVGSASGYAESELAVDNSTGSGKGNIYLAQADGTIRVYNEAGKALSEIGSEVGNPWGEACGVAVDDAGTVYVALSPSNINEYTPQAGPPNSFSFGASFGGLDKPCAVAVDSEHNVFVVSTKAGSVTRYDANQLGQDPAVGHTVNGVGDAVAVDPATDDVLVDEGWRVTEFGPHGEPFEQPMRTFSTGIAGSFAIAANGNTGEVYVSDESKSPYHVAIYGPLTPSVEAKTGQAANLLQSSASLTGHVNPEGAPIERCYFEYGSSTNYGTTVPCQQSPGEIGTGFQPVEVRADLTGLLGGAVYHYRLVAEASRTPYYGEDIAFTTAGPLIAGTAVASVGETGATLQAEVNPRGVATTYQFEYGPTTAYGASLPLPAASAGSAPSFQTVTVGLTGLSPGQTYHFRLVATDAEGSVLGPDTSFTTYAASLPSDEACPNEAVRNAQGSTTLPECRAYELVSPLEKNGGNVAADGTMTQASITGDAVKYTSTTAFGDTMGSEVRGAEYMSQRGTEGWITHGIDPAQQEPVDGLAKSSQYQYLTPDLSKGVYYGLSPVVPGHPNVERAANLYLRTDMFSAPPGTYELLSDSEAPVPARPPFTPEGEVSFAAASSDMSRILFESFNDLTKTAAGLGTRQPKLYEWHNGTVSLAGILPDGHPAPGSMAGAGSGVGSYVGFEGHWALTTMSPDGSRVIFEAAPFHIESGPAGGQLGAAGTLYMRIDGRETISLESSERTDCNVERKEREPQYKCTGALEPDPNGPQPAVFLGASNDDSKVFFMAREALTDDAQGVGTGGTAENLYMFDIDAPVGKRLTLLSKDTNPADREGGNCGCGRDRVLGVAGISSDGSFVYFTSPRALRTGDPTAYSTAQGNLYVWHDGSLRLVTTQYTPGTTETVPLWGELGRGAADGFRITPDGQTIAFVSEDPELAEKLGFIPHTIAGRTFGYYSSVYVYSYASDRLTCASCNRNGLPLSSSADFAVLGQGDSQDAFGLSETNNQTMYLNRALTEDGSHAFFDTGEALVPQDTNSRRDVYEYDTVTGEVHLLTTGRCDCDATFVDASPDGKNVYVVTHEKLVTADSDSAGDLYDVRVDGGFLRQSSPARPGCMGDQCQPEAAPLAPLAAPPSNALTGIKAVLPSGSPPGSAKHTLTRDQKLAKALRRCARVPKRRRSQCRRAAQRRFGPFHRKSARATTRKHKGGR